ncbi:hypothetical protein ACSSWA_13350 [Melioribacter sp. Ez-97]|uniref:hypothetical protein n=1 Tax=Melioribacter sp. Ez-97 TaxID=3423434 RepID=UPI003EDB4119
MSEQKQYLRIWGITLGQLAFGMFLIAVVSGILLAIPYDVRNPYESMSQILLLTRFNFVRSLHYWSSQFFLVFTVLHFWDHLRLSTEYRVSKNLWLRLTVSILLIIYLMLSGFILKADADSLQAHSIFNNLLNKIPFIGGSISYLFMGKFDNLQLLYIHHAATATIFILLFIIEHVKSYWPQSKAIFFGALTVLIVGIILPPTIHDGFNPVVKGPWYLVGVQEFLHWMNWPEVFLLLIVSLLVVIYMLRFAGKGTNLLLKKTLAFLFAVYIVLSIIGFYFRGENWNFGIGLENEYAVGYNNSVSLKELFSVDDAVDKQLVKAGERYEGCMACHSDMKGFSVSHDISALGCYSCHRGNPFTLNKKDAHENMILIPGNLSNAQYSCGSAQCHPDIVPRVNNSIMTTLSGMISVNKFVFGELESPDSLGRISEIGFSPAEKHLRNLCASCHLGNEKTEFGEINEESRGGGCLACHLDYSPQAYDELIRYNKNKEGHVHKFHPSLQLPDNNYSCFGCHSRSGRISTNYEGWAEVNDTTLIYDTDMRRLKDGRIFKRMTPDVHFEKGMLCIDCHLSSEIMGDGKNYTHKEQQTVIQCADCHNSNERKTIKVDEFDYESRKISELRNFDAAKKYLLTNKNNLPITNVFEEDGKIMLIKKSSGKIAEARPPLKQCANDIAHKDLDCQTCHTSWATQCIGCHTEFDKASAAYDHLEKKITEGEWIEHAGEYLSEPPALGVAESESGRKITTFVPGMIISIDRDNSSHSDEIIFKRLYAPAFSHTIRKESRSCQSCHNNPLAIGYGRGKLILDKSGDWLFTPYYSRSVYDNLPRDAWIDFLTGPKPRVSTRKNYRPFNLEEQKKILRVGACLTCHPSDSQIMKKSLENFDALLNKLSPKCIIPN